MSEALLSGVDIGKVMASTGPIIKCVILRARPLKGNVDLDRDVTTLSIREIKDELETYGSDPSAFVEKPELVKALDEARSNREAAPQAPSPGAPQDAQSDQDGKKESSDENAVPLSDLIEEIEVDTTPRKSMVSKILGGDFTFIGQYEEEGTMVMARRPDWENEDSCIPEADIPPVNPHKLQPPLHDIEIRGDVLLMRVAETDEALDSDDDAHEDAENRKDKESTEEEKSCDVASGDDGRAEEPPTESPQKAAEKEIKVPSNEEFFLDYTRDEYLKFASRTDIVAKDADEPAEEEEEEANEDEEEVAGSEEESENEDEKLESNEANGVHHPENIVKIAAKSGYENEEDEHDEDFEPEEEEEEEDFDSEEHQVGMMNLILGQILRKFHEENGRGPDTLELLEMRKALADRLGVEVPPVDEDACDWDKKIATPKRHNKKVKVVEENNESETIPRADDEDDEFVGLKRPAEAMKSEEDDVAQQSSKKAKLDETSICEEGDES